MKLVAIYKQPANASEFDEAYFKTHLPLMSKVPGLQKFVITRFTRTIMGEGVYLMGEFYFSDQDSLRAAMKSPEMAAAGDNLNTFAKGLVILSFGQEETAATNPAAGTSIPTTA